MFRRIKPEQPLPVPMQNRSGRDHLGIKKCTARDEAQEKPIMPIGPVHHGGDGNSFARGSHGGDKQYTKSRPALSVLTCLMLAGRAYLRFCGVHAIIVSRHGTVGGWLRFFRAST